MTTVSTADLNARHGLTHNTLNRLVDRGVLTPGGHRGSGNHFWWDDAEQRAAAAVIAFQRSHLLNIAPYRTKLSDPALRAVAESARTHQPGDASVRWIMLLEDGTCLRVGDELAARWPEARTLIEIGPWPRYPQSPQTYPHVSHLADEPGR